MNDRHSPEPWEAGERTCMSETMSDGNYGDIIAADGTQICCSSRECGMLPKNRNANVARIVACVNACAGISTELLDRYTDDQAFLRRVARTSVPNPGSKTNYAAADVMYALHAIIPLESLGYRVLFPSEATDAIRNAPDGKIVPISPNLESEP